MSAAPNTDIKPLDTNPLVYVAEDDSALLDLAEMLLKSEGISCRKFDNPEHALKAFKEANPKPRLIISDYSMGIEKMDGLTFLTACKRLQPDVRTFLISGTVDEAVLPKVENPVDRFLVKPYATADFLATVRQLLKK